MVSSTVAVAPLAKNVVVFRNGDPFFLGRKVVVSQRRFLTFDAFLNEVTSNIQAPVAVRNIYTPREGHRVAELSELQNGCRYVAAGFERFKRLDYANPGMKQLKKHQKENGAQHYPGIPQKMMVTAGWKRQTHLPCIIYVFRNGDLLSPPFRMVLPRAALQEWPIVLGRLSEKANLRTGAVKKNFPPNRRRSHNRGVVSEDVASDSALLEPAQELKLWRVHSTGIVPAGGPPRPSEPKPAKKHLHQDKATSVFHAKPSQAGQVSQAPGNSAARENESVYKRRGPRREMMDAQEIGEDEETQVELPVDQKAAEIVEEEVISKTNRRPPKKGF
ncbi:doublecortin domain-containing protein 2B isoform X2 [Erythrolamprus reginae]|uniref:doublecortin domain-containing protein 2B isoform X2 n=1 Tax=Erythrolamprus reginae TaxID=121349 RepID=UPI00396CF875